MVAGLAMAIAGTALIAFIQADWAFYTGLIIAGVGTGLQLPGLNNLITSSARSEQRAMITSVYGAVRFIGVAFGPPLYGAADAQRRGAALLVLRRHPGHVARGDALPHPA